MQKKLNLHYSLSLDLFGSEVSTNAANAFNAGIKGRYQEIKIDDDHQLKDATYPVVQFVDGKIVKTEAPALSAINQRLRDDYIRDASGGVGRWNKTIAKCNIPFEMKLPHEAFHREIGAFERATLAYLRTWGATRPGSSRRRRWGRRVFSCRDSRRAISRTATGRSTRRR
jgi:benzoyl-CoA 2,3-dioxygenase component B